MTLNSGGIVLINLQKKNAWGGVPPPVDGEDGKSV
jgi:hypothetical protein